MTARSDTHLQYIQSVALAGNEPIVRGGASVGDNAVTKDKASKYYISTWHLRAVRAAGGEDDTVGSRGLVVARGRRVDLAVGHDGELRNHAFIVDLHN